MLPQARSGTGRDRPKGRFAAQKKQGALADGEQTQHGGVFISLLDRTMSLRAASPLAVRGPTSVCEYVYLCPTRPGHTTRRAGQASTKTNRAAALPCGRVGEEGQDACEAASLETEAANRTLAIPEADNELASAAGPPTALQLTPFRRRAPFHASSRSSFVAPSPCAVDATLAPTGFVRLQAGTSVSEKLPPSLAC